MPLSRWIGYVQSLVQRFYLAKIYLLGLFFIVASDHNALTYLLTIPECLYLKGPKPGKPKRQRRGQRQTD